MIEPAPTRDHTELMLRAAGAQCRPTRPSSVSVDPPERSAARLGRRAGRLLVGRAVHRRRDADPRVADHDPRRQPQPAPHRPARRARADGRPRRDPRRAARIGAEQVGDLEVRCGRADRDDDQARRGAAARRRAAALRAARGARARRELGLRRRRAAAQGDRPDRGASSTRCARSACAPRRTRTGFSVTGVPDASARRQESTRGATTGSRCSALLQGLRRARASRSRAPRAWR